MNSGKAYLRIAPDLLTVETGDEESYSFDHAGCLVRAAFAGATYRWALDGGCLVKQRTPHGAPRQRAFLTPEAGLQRADDAYRQAARLLADVETVDLRWQALRQLVLESGFAQMQQRCAQYPMVYKPVGIMPPDQYGALVLQLTEGCRYNRCAFCTFYKNMPYRVKSVAEFSNHVEAVQRLLGKAINRRHTVFLGDANALALPVDELCAAFDVIHRLLPASASADGIYTFMDVFGRRPRQAGDFAALARKGLRRVYIGAESGSREVLRILRKPEEAHILRSNVQAMKEGGIGVGLVFLLGAGGERWADIHATESAQLLASLPLDQADIVYFSELVAEPGSEYAVWAAKEGVAPLSRAAMREQEREIRRGLVPVDQGGPRVTRYDVREFVYY